MKAVSIRVRKLKIKEHAIYKKISPLLTKVADKRLDMYSAGAAFFIFMSFIPFTLILLSTVKYLPFSKDDLFALIDKIFPTDLNSWIVYIIDDLYRRGIGVLSVSVIAAIWASGKGLLGITKGLNEIHEVKSGGNFLYLRTRSVVCTLFLMIGMILLLVISVFGRTITGIVERFIAIPKTVTNLLAASSLIMWFVLFLLFLFFFTMLPNRNLSIKSQIPGAAGASLLWILFTKLFSFYLSTFNGYSMYGSFAVILVTGVWLYAGMYIMFMGALVNVYLASRKG